MALAGHIAGHRSAVRMEARLGPFANPGRVTLGPAGMTFVERKAIVAFQWSEIAAVRARRGAVEVRIAGPHRRLIRFVPVVEGVREPTLIPSFVRVVEDMRASRFSFNGTSWHEHQNAIERLRPEFTDQDEPVIATAAVGLWLSLGVALVFLIPVALNVAEVRALPAGAFVLRDRIGPLDPRTLVSAFALSALAAMLVLRLALGHQALVWARGAARGWKHGARRTRLAFQLFARMLLGTSSAAVLALLALLTFWPNAAATVLIDANGVRNAVLLPFISIDERWAGGSVVPDDDGVLIRFPDGRAVGTAGRELGGGTPEQLLTLAQRWSRGRG